MPITSSGGGGGSGNVSGAASSTDNAVARFDGAGGKTLQNSVVTVSDTGIVATTSTQAFRLGSNDLQYEDGVGPKFQDNSGAGFALSIDIQSLSADRIVTAPDAAGTMVLATATQTLTAKTLTDPLLAGGLKLKGRTSSAAAATTTEYPADKDCGIHKNTNTGAIHLVYNDGGVMMAVELTVIV